MCKYHDHTELQFNGNEGGEYKSGGRNHEGRGVNRESEEGEIVVERG